MDAIDEPGDEQRTPDRLIRPVVWIVSLVIIAVLIGIPVLRAVNYSRRQDPARAADEARLHVATQFAIAALERRSTRLAEQWAVDGLHAGIDAVVADLQLRDAAELEGATARIDRAACDGTVADPTAACFVASLVRPDGHVVTRVSLTVAIVDGRAQVVRVGASA